MDDEKWPLTSRAIAESERATKGDYDLIGDDEPERGHALLHLFAEEYEAAAWLGPGVLYVRKVEP